jgi:Mn-dependent DtxR family transcriptional regulator
VLEVLEKVKKPMSRGQIAQMLGFDAVTVSHAIARLLKGNDIKCMEIDCEEAMKFYNCHRRMKIYYLEN